MNIRQGVLPCASECVYMSAVSPKSLLAKILHQAVRGALPPWPSTMRTQGTHGSDANATHPPSTSYSPSSGAGELPPHWGQPFKWQGNIMQEHRKSEETGFWAGLARILCELQRTSGLCSAGLKPAESLPRAVGRAGGRAEPATSCLWPVGGRPELDVPDRRLINASPNISTFLAQVQGDSPTLLHCDSPLSYSMIGPSPRAA